jgi:hypothetical protein
VAALYLERRKHFEDSFLKVMPPIMNDFQDPPEGEDEEDFKPIRDDKLVNRPKASNYVFMKLIKNYGSVTSNAGNIQFSQGDIFFMPYESSKVFLQKDYAELA